MGRQMPWVITLQRINQKMPSIGGMIDIAFLAKD
jgi:hypothetical protein